MKIKLIILLLLFIFLSCANIYNTEELINRSTIDYSAGVSNDELFINFSSDELTLSDQNIFFPPVQEPFFGNQIIGRFTNGTDMYIRRYGYGKDNKNAIFFIARIHGNEDGAERSVRIIENFLIENPSLVLENTSVFFLNPASVEKSRHIYNEKHPNGEDPNRNFLDLDLNETKAIASFIEKLALNWENVTVISSHHYNDTEGERRSNGIGWVFPLYNLTQAGLRIIEGRSGSAIIILKRGDGFHYTNSRASDDLARIFSQLVNYQYEPMWQYNHNTNEAQMYPGELLYFISRLNQRLSKSVRVIEFEVPLSDRFIESINTRNGLISFIKYLLSE